MSQTSASLVSAPSTAAQASDDARTPVEQDPDAELEATSLPTAVTPLRLLPTRPSVLTKSRNSDRTQREIVSHHWECTVDSVGPTFFVATLRSLLKDRTTDKIAEIPREDVQADDLELLAPGAVFYWTIGYEISVGGTRRRTSELKFRRLPSWTKKELARVKARADELYGMFGGEVADADVEAQGGGRAAAR